MTSYGRGLDSTALAPLPAQDRMYPFGIIMIEIAAAWYDLTRPRAFKKFVNRVCFFVLCKRHWINRVPGAHQGDSLCIPFTLTLTLVMPSYL